MQDLFVRRVGARRPVQVGLRAQVHRASLAVALHPLWVLPRCAEWVQAMFAAFDLLDHCGARRGRPFLFAALWAGVRARVGYVALEAAPREFAGVRCVLGHKDLCLLHFVFVFVFTGEGKLITFSSLRGSFMDHFFFGPMQRLWVSEISELVKGRYVDYS